MPLILWPRGLTKTAHMKHGQPAKVETELECIHRDERQEVPLLYPALFSQVELCAMTKRHEFTMLENLEKLTKGATPIRDFDLWF